MKKYLLLTIVTTLVSFPLLAQNIRPAGLNAYVGVGFAEFTVDTPSSNFEMDRGLFASIAGEKGFGILGSYLTFSINRSASEGTTNYSYTPLSGPTVSQNNVDFSAEMFQFGLGYKIKFFEGFWFRPYGEVGYLGGSYLIKYSGLSDSSAKDSERLFDGGPYGEAGVEIDFSDSFALKVAARQTQMTTKELETLADSKIEYKSTIVFLSALMAF